MNATVGWLLSVCVCVVLAASCATNQNPSPATEPLDSAEQSLLHQAEEILMRACMADNGFSYAVVPEQPMPFYKRFPYVVDDETWARDHGFGNALRRELKEQDDPNQRYYDALPESELAKALVAANGPSPDGLTAISPTGVQITRSDRSCTSQAERKLYGDLQTWFQAMTVTDALPIARREQVVADTRYRVAVAGWARCMAERGYDYADPGRLHDAFRAEGPEEIAAATTEVICGRITGFAAVARELDAQYEDRQREQYRTEIADRLRLERAALPTALVAVEHGAR
ncbi:hypothetical protein FHS29_000775 [Saccharothrix tamanrassetensis]|uniref:Secreted protein n=1 Tax=Saccharothrix tamanrassetensis TaxID=1051531 RepID=A0A841CDV3_9PSEU|nr:hypothetical protein [Saccharothrix tamanrassetensis]MBB5954205.1 hypothetical protein [Saccharothrix tamanrassetensis]